MRRAHIRVAFGLDPRSAFHYFQRVDNEPGITAVLDDIKTELTGLHAQSKFLNEVIDRLHTENERLRRAEAQSALQPPLRELIKLADNWRSRLAAVAENPDLTRLCGEVVEDVAMILERQGIEEFCAEPGAVFDRQQHRAIGTQPTTDEKQDGVVAEARRPGYLSEGRVVRFAEVVVYKLIVVEG